jgi:hypothetical protein
MVNAVDLTSGFIVKMAGFEAEASVEEVVGTEVLVIV